MLAYPIQKDSIWKDKIIGFRNVKKSDFDLIFFHTEEFPFKIVQTACNSKWCHVALILLLTKKDVIEIRRMWKSLNDKSTAPTASSIDDRDQKQEVYILESTTDTYPCAVTGQRTDGVKLCLLKDRLPDGDVCGYKRVSKKKIESTRANKQMLLYDIVPRLLGTPYERKLLNLAKAWAHWMGCCFLTSYDESSMFCTELLTHVFTRLGALEARHEGGLFEKSNYTDEDLVLEDYVILEQNLLVKEGWLHYHALEYVNVEATEM